MNKRIYCCLLFALLLISCSQTPQTPPDSVKANRVAKFESVLTTIADCPGSIMGYKTSCYTLEVPENRTKPDSATINLQVYVYHPLSKSPQPNPVLILSVVPLEDFKYYTSLEKIMQEYSVIFFQIRGFHGQQCQRMQEVYYQTLEQDRYGAQVQSRFIEAGQVCRQEWAQYIRDQAGYNSEEIAADVEDLRLAMGIKQWNIFAQEYGTRITYFLMRDYPDGIRSAILNMAEPLKGDIYSGTAVSAQRTLELFFQRCAEHEQCNQIYPDLKKVFYEVVDQLNLHPLVLKVNDLASGNTFTIQVDSQRFIEQVVTTFRRNEVSFVAELPQMIYQTSQGKTDKLSAMVGRFIEQDIPKEIIMKDRINCVERVQYITLETVKASNQSADPRIAAGYNRQYEQLIETCKQVWGDLYNQQSKQVTLRGWGNIPVLIVNGDQNSLSGTDWPKDVAKGLGKSTVVEVTFSGPFDWMYGKKGDCMKPIMSAFLADPTSPPDITCAAEPRSILWLTLQ